MGTKASTDFANEWRESHPEIVKQYRGKQIAIHRTRGIIASGDRFREILEKVWFMRDIMIEDVVFDAVEN